MFKVKKRESLLDDDEVSLPEVVPHKDESNDEEFYDELDKENFDDDYGLGGGSPPLEKHSDLLKNLTDFDPYLKNLFNNWLGLTWDESKSKYVPNPFVRQIMNLRGAAWCIGVLKTYARKNNIITHIRDKEYKEMMSDIIENVWLNLGTREEFGVKSEGDIMRVCLEMEHAAALVLMGAGDGKYNKFLGTTYTSHENGQQRSPVMGNYGKPPSNNMVDKIKKVLVG